MSKVTPGPAPQPVTEDTSDWTPVRIEAPLPLGVAGALLQLIGAAWPESVIETGKNKRAGFALNMLIPPNQPAQTVDEEFIAAIRAGTEGEHADAEFLEFRDGRLAFAPPEELCLELGNMAHAIFTANQPAAINHVEWEVRTGDRDDDPRYVLSISVGKDKTPLAMRKTAEAEVKRLRKLLKANGIDAGGQ